MKEEYRIQNRHTLELILRVLNAQQQGGNCSFRVLRNDYLPTNRSIQIPKIVAIAIGEAQQVNPHTFGRFLPPFVLIVNEIGDSTMEDKINLGNSNGKETLKR